jgi:hypothetical protein
MLFVRQVPVLAAGGLSGLERLRSETLGPSGQAVIRGFGSVPVRRASTIQPPQDLADLNSAPSILVMHLRLRPLVLYQPSFASTNFG